MKSLDLKTPLVRDAIPPGNKSPLDYYEWAIAIVADYTHTRLRTCWSPSSK